MTDATNLTGPSLLAMSNAQWLAMDPAHFDALVTALMTGEKAEHWGMQLWRRLSQPSVRKAQPLMLAAFCLARARMSLPSSRENARSWLAQAQACAGQPTLDDAFDLAKLRTQINQAPQIIDGRFVPDACRLSAFEHECWVVCPKCGGAAVEAEKVVRCTACLHRATYDGTNATWEDSKSPWFRLPLLLTTSTPNGEIWAYNDRHLAQLRCYVAATLRDERRNNNASWSSRLPTWMKAAKNRERVLKALDRLAVIAATSGLTGWSVTFLHMARQPPRRLRRHPS